MIQLKNISTAGIISSSTGIDNYEKLKQLIISDNRYYKKFESDLIMIEKYIEYFNKLGYDPKVYPIDYKFSFNNEELIKDTDKMTGGEELLVDNPLELHSIKRTVLGKHSIYDIKNLLNYCIVGPNIDGVENALLYYTKFIEEKDIQNILSAILLYNRQLENQYDFQKDGNLFYQNYEVKRQLIISNLEYILNYIKDEKINFFWGQITELQFNELFSSMKYSTLRLREVQQMFINVLSNYTSLSDFENNKITEKTLKKFITKDEVK